MFRKSGKSEKRRDRGGTGIVLYAASDLCSESSAICGSGFCDNHAIPCSDVSDNSTYPEQSGCKLLASGECLLLHLLPRVVQPVGTIRICCRAVVSAMGGSLDDAGCNDAIYQRIASPVWNVMLVLTFAYVMYCVRRSLTFDEKMLEDYTNEIRI